MLYKGDPTHPDIEKAPLRFSNRRAGGYIKITGSMRTPGAMRAPAGQTDAIPASPLSPLPIGLIEIRCFTENEVHSSMHCCPKTCARLVRVFQLRVRIFSHAIGEMSNEIFLCERRWMLITTIGMNFLIKSFTSGQLTARRYF